MNRRLRLALAALGGRAIITDVLIVGEVHARANQPLLMDRVTMQQPPPHVTPPPTWRGLRADLRRLLGGRW